LVVVMVVRRRRSPWMFLLVVFLCSSASYHVSPALFFQPNSVSPDTHTYAHCSHPTNAQEERLREVGQHEHELALAAEQLVETKDFTWRAIILGLDSLSLSPSPPLPHIFVSLRVVASTGSLVGGLMCFSNMYFGLQSGWVTLGSLQSALLGFAALKVITALMPSRPGLVSRILGMGPFGPKENVRDPFTSPHVFWFIGGRLPNACRLRFS